MSRLAHRRGRPSNYRKSLQGNELLERIDQIISTKKSENKSPLHALFYRDLLPGNDREELKQSLRELARQGKIHIGNTINDYYITIKT